MNIPYIFDFLHHLVDWIPLDEEYKGSTTPFVTSDRIIVITQKKNQRNKNLLKRGREVYNSSRVVSWINHARDDASRVCAPGEPSPDLFKRKTFFSPLLRSIRVTN
jgi:hypothetical protein